MHALAQGWKPSVVFGSRAVLDLDAIVGPSVGVARFKLVSTRADRLRLSVLISVAGPRQLCGSNKLTFAVLISHPNLLARG